MSYLPFLVFSEQSSTQTNEFEAETWKKWSYSIHSVIMRRIFKK